MKLFTGWMILAGLVLSAAAANAQGVAPYPSGSSRSTVVSDFGGPYAGMPPPEAPMPGYGPPLLPPQEVYAIVRENGFSPLGIPRQRGFIYTISVIDHSGDDGRLVIDARTGRIIRFMPAYGMGDNFNGGMMPPYGPSYGPPGPPPPISNMRGEPRPPVSVPRMASRTPQVPLPKAAPPRAGEVKPLAAQPVPAPVQQSAAVQARPADTPTPPPAAPPPVVEAKPAAPPIQPTQEMPKAQGLD